ncbi:hypothetical protein KKD19_03530 [Patescibacteria group bacterium]|nr:hypothetical protein [Patescibacteria group bacterium]MBU4512285.1 hypothetical protein [Patescibacteria group bacterium]MCG2693639.1 hypothetical protein [Candidatus Parcubacteria bacterium]
MTQDLRVFKKTTSILSLAIVVLLASLIGAFFIRQAYGFLESTTVPTTAGNQSSAAADQALLQQIDTKLDGLASGGSPGEWTCVVREEAQDVDYGLLTAYARCLSNEKVISGGCDKHGGGPSLHASRPLNQGWFCKTWHDVPHGLTAYANCCK